MGGGSGEWRFRGVNLRDILRLVLTSSEVWLQMTYSESSIVESVVLVSLEEVSVSVGVLEGGINVIRNAFPVAEWFRIRRLHGWSLEWIESPELTSLVEVNLAVSTPDHRRIDVVGDSGESFVDLLRVLAVERSPVVSPVLRSLEEVRLAVFVGECGVDVVGKTRPAFWDCFRVAISDGVLREAVVFVALECVSGAVAGVEDRVDLRVATKRVVVSRHCRCLCGLGWRSRSTGRSAKSTATTAAAGSWRFSAVKCLDALIMEFTLKIIFLISLSSTHLNVVGIESEYRVVSTVERCHQCASDVGMT